MLGSLSYLLFLMFCREAGLLFVLLGTFPESRKYSSLRAYRASGSDRVF